MKLNIRKIEEAIDGGWISKRKHPDANLYILNYTPQTQYEGYWHPHTTMICRGLIVDDKWNVIARPFPKFFSIDQLTEGRNKVHYLYGKKFKTLFNGKFEAYDKADGCFQYYTRVMLPDGKHEYIGKIINSKRITHVLGFKDGKVQPVKILNRFKNGQKDNWLKVSFDYKWSNRSESRKYLEVTDNHKFYDGNRYKEISLFNDGDSLYIQSELLNSTQNSFVIGSLLGDSSISFTGSNNRGILQGFHKEAHAEYVELKKHILGNLSTNLNYTRTSGYGTKMIPYSSIATTELKFIRENWYPNDTKKIPSNIKLDAISLAFWYMDDGSLSHTECQNDRIRLATNGFSKECCEVLVKELERLYPEISCTLYESKGWCLRINYSNGKAINQLWGDIAKYFPVCMQYKLPQKYRTGKPSILLKEEQASNAGLLPITITKIEKLNNKYHAYDLETESHNYFVNNILVHNSLGILYPLGDKVYVATRGSFESEMAIKASQILEDMGYADKKKWKRNSASNALDYCTFLFEIVYPENRIVVDYGEEEKLVLLDVLDTETGKRNPSALWMVESLFECVKKYDHIKTLEDLENENDNYDGREGYVLVFEDGFRVKWKYDEYKRLHRILTGLTPNVVFDWVRSGENLEKVLAEVPDEFYNWATDLATVYEARYKEVEDAVKAVYEEVKNKDWTRKDIALAYQDYEHRGLLFAMLDEKDYSDSIWKIVKEKEKENERSRNAPSILD